MQQDTDVQILMRAFGFADGGLGIAANLPGSSSTSAQPMTDSQTTADRALASLAEQYRNLQLQAGRILSLFGSDAPCEVINRHYDAVQNYMAAASDVFGQLTRQGFTVVQQLYNLQGEKTGEQKGPEPVKPAYFEPCASGLKGANSFRDSTQFGHMMLNLGVTTDNGLGVLPVVAWIIIALIAGGTVVAVTHTIVVNNPALPIKQVEAQGIWMDNYLSCVERTMKSSSDMTHDRADALCRGLTAPPAPPKPIDLNQILFYGLIGLGIVGAAALLAFALKRARELEPVHAPELEPEGAGDGYLLDLPASDVPLLAAAAPDAVLEGADEPAYVRWCPCR
jgi:hypothetical protein